MGQVYSSRILPRISTPLLGLLLLACDMMTPQPHPADRASSPSSSSLPQSPCPVAAPENRPKRSPVRQAKETNSRQPKKHALANALPEAGAGALYGPWTPSPPPPRQSGASEKGREQRRVPKNKSRFHRPPWFSQMQADGTRSDVFKGPTPTGHTVCHQHDRRARAATQSCVANPRRENYPRALGDRFPMKPSVLPLINPL